MSVLSYPRIHFKGKCRVSPATGNNDDVAVNIDAVNVALLPALADLEDEDARAWMMGEFQAIGPDKVTLQTYLRSGWNYFGTLQARFEGARVVSVVGEDGCLTTDDLVVGKTIKILAARTSGTLERQAAKFQRKLLSGVRLPLKGDVAPPASGRRVGARCRSRWSATSTPWAVG